MPISNFPNGFSQGVNISGFPRLDMFSGKVLWVDSATGSNGNKGTHDRPFATIDYAVGLCTANKGDIILVREAHAETIVGVGGIALDVAGISVIGLGKGNQRPKITMTPTAATGSITISAAGVTVQNLIISANYADIATCFNVTAKDANIINIEFVDTATNMNFLSPISATGATTTADGLTVIGCRWFTPDAAATSFVNITDNVDRLTLADNFVVAKAGTATPFVLSAGSKVVTNALITRNTLQNGNTANDVFIDNGGAANTGIVSYNLVGNLDVTGAQTFGAATGLQFFENYTTSTSTEAGALAQAADTPLS